MSSDMRTFRVDVNTGNEGPAEAPNNELCENAGTLFRSHCMSRREDLRLVTGQGRYTSDWNLPGQLHAVFLRADRAHAEILRLNAAQALAHPGVVAVLTGEDARQAGFKS